MAEASDLALGLWWAIGMSLKPGNGAWPPLATADTSWKSLALTGLSRWLRSIRSHGWGGRPPQKWCEASDLFHILPMPLLATAQAAQVIEQPAALSVLAITGRASPMGRLLLEAFLIEALNLANGLQ